MHNFGNAKLIRIIRLASFPDHLERSRAFFGSVCASAIQMMFSSSIIIVFQTQKVMSGTKSSLFIAYLRNVPLLFTSFAGEWLKKAGGKPFIHKYSEKIIIQKTIIRCFAQWQCLKDDSAYWDSFRNLWYQSPQLLYSIIEAVAKHIRSNVMIFDNPFLWLYSFSSHFGKCLISFFVLVYIKNWMPRHWRFTFHI